MQTKIIKCKDCGQHKPHKLINRDYNRVTGSARKWAAICNECLAKPIDPRELFTTEEIKAKKHLTSDCFK